MLVGCQEPRRYTGLSDGRLPQPRSQTRSRLLRWRFQGANTLGSRRRTRRRGCGDDRDRIGPDREKLQQLHVDDNTGSVPTIFVPEPLDPTVTAVWVGANRVRFSWREQDANQEIPFGGR